MAGRGTLPPATRSGGGWLIAQAVCVATAGSFHLKYGCKLIYLKFAILLLLKHQLKFGSVSLKLSPNSHEGFKDAL
jgi:hypothetical protein